MTVRCVGKFTIAVGIDTYRDMESSIKNMYKELIQKGITCKMYFGKRLIILDHIIIKFIVRRTFYHFNRNIFGVKCNGCYGFTTEETYNITRGHNKCQYYDLMDYILENNKG